MILPRPFIWVLIVVGLEHILGVASLSTEYYLRVYEIELFIGLLIFLSIEFFVYKYSKKWHNIASKDENISCA